MFGAGEFDNVGHLVSTVGLPTALVVVFVFFVWRIWKFFAPRVDSWYTSQRELVDVLKVQTKRMGDNIDALSNHAQHDHRAMHHALRGFEEHAKGNQDKAIEHAEKAKDELLD